MSTFPDIKPRLSWPETALEQRCFLPAVTLAQGESLQLICPEYCQSLLLEFWFSERSNLSVRAAGHKKRYKTFGHAVAVVLNGKALVANLTIRENIMLPFLYHYDSEMAIQAQSQLQRVAEMFGLSSILFERAGVRSPLVHGLVSLCRAVLQQAHFIVMQQPCASMDVQEAEAFSKLAKHAIKGLDAGMVYLTTSAEDQGGFSFAKQIGILGDGATL